MARSLLPAVQLTVGAADAAGTLCKRVRGEGFVEGSFPYDC